MKINLTLMITKIAMKWSYNFRYVVKNLKKPDFRPCMPGKPRKIKNKPGFPRYMRDMTKH